MQPLENAGKYATGGARIVLTWHSIGREKQRVFSDWWNFCFFLHDCSADENYWKTTLCTPHETVTNFIVFSFPGII